jgi:hypothetical protein
MHREEIMVVVVDDLYNKRFVKENSYQKEIYYSLK